MQKYRDRQKIKETCVKFFVEKYDMVTVQSGEEYTEKQEGDGGRRGRG